MGGALTGKSKPKNWYERLDEDFRATILGFGFIVFLVLLVAFRLSNLFVGDFIFTMFAGAFIAGFAFVFGLAFLITIYGKYKTRGFAKRDRTNN